MVLNNKNLGGRYILLEKVGGGGMAVVYKATDTILNRTVAIKLLRSEFSNDPEFVKNFENEAQSAASLSHPNVVNIFDVGKDQEDHYIVMEYIEGKTLKEVIQERAPLSSSEVVEIAKQICDALDHAHQNHIIHRDIKPHNIMINKFGRIKVTDFGIARAVTSSTITYQADSVLGSVHYFSPEQARGGIASASSDIYSLGVVMYEMLTGKLPFSGESPISIALKHLQDELTEPSIYNRDIPSNLENIVLRTLAKNPLQRYETAEQMLKDLKIALNSQHKIPRIYEVDEQGEPTKVIPIIKASDFKTNEEKLKKKPPTPEYRTPLRGDRHRTVEPADVEEEEEVSIFEKTSFRIGLIIAFLAALGMISIYVYNSVVDILYVPEVQIPTVTGEPLGDAILKLNESGFLAENIVEISVKDPEVPEGYVVRQDPEADTTVKVTYSPINLYVSEGKEKTPMPELIGKSVSQAKVLLNQLGIEFEIKEEHRDNVAAGQVYDQIPYPEAEIVADEVQAVLYVSKGQQSFAMPNLVSKTINEAEAILKEKQLVRGTIHNDPSYTIPKGEVTRQEPYQENAEVAPGEIIDLWVSSGYPADAKLVEEVILVQPSQQGEPTDVVIRVNDARGNDQVYFQETITEEMTFHVQLVLAPNTFGNVEVYLNGVFADTRAVSY